MVCQEGKGAREIVHARNIEKIRWVFKLKKYYQNVTLSVLCKSKSVHRDCGCRVDFIHFYFHECWNMVLHMLIGASLKGEEINCVYLWTSSKLIAPERNELNQILRIKRIQERYINHFVNLLRIIHVLLSIFYVIEKHCVFHSWFQSRKVITTDYEISYDFVLLSPFVCILGFVYQLFINMYFSTIASKIN